MQSDCQSVNLRYNTFVTRISEKPKNEEELVALKDYIRDGSATMISLAGVRTEANVRWRLLVCYGCSGADCWCIFDLLCMGDCRRRWRSTTG